MIGYIISLIVGGLVIGALGRLVHPGHDPIGIWATIGIGVLSMFIVGIVLHGALGAVLSFIVAVIVAALLVAVWSRYMGPTRLRGARRL